MKWQGLRRSSNVEDRRSLGGKSAAGGVGGVFALALVVYLLGGDPSALLQEGISRSIQSSTRYESKLTPEQQNEQADFVSAVLGSTEDVWGQIFAQQGATYEQPRLVLFAGASDSACGMAQSAMGPFYCPNDRTVYLDLDFFQEMETRLNAPGDFASAYVIAHEVGHHIQNLLGVIPKVRQQQQRASKTKTNELSVRTELQADCFSGVWAHAVGEFDALEKGDIEEALHAASQIGDDTLQQEAQGYVVPDSFTHGSAAQRYTWFRKGFEAGNIEFCDTFGADEL